MKIALVNQPWNAVVPEVDTGSVAIWIDRVAGHLARHHDVLVYGGGDVPQPVERRHDGIRFRTLPLGRDRGLARLLPRIGRLTSRRRPPFASRLYYPTFTRNLAADLVREGADVVHLHNLSQMVAPVRRAAPRARIVLHMHCEWLTQLEPRMIARRLARVDAVLGPSSHVVDRVRAAFRDLAGRCHVVPNGVDVERFRPPERPADPTAATAGPQSLLFVGRLSPEKGIHVLLEAFGRLLPDQPDARLCVVGPDAPTPPEFLVGLSDDPRVADLAPLYRGGYAQRLRALVPTGAGRQVVFQGAVPHREMPAVYREADVLVNPSLSESFGISLIEAMACGLPVVAASTGGMTDIVEHERTGLLVAPGDPADLQAALQRLCGDPELRRAMGRAGRERAVAKFAWPEIAAGLNGIYQSIGQGTD